MTLFIETKIESLLL